MVLMYVYGLLTVVQPPHERETAHVRDGICYFDHQHFQCCLHVDCLKMVSLQLPLCVIILLCKTNPYVRPLFLKSFPFFSSSLSL